jgi:plastocyanin
MKAGLSFLVLSFSLGAQAATHIINVAGTTQLLFHPSKLTTRPGDAIEFVFSDKVPQRFKKNGS